ncbi:MAG: hypothetical protein BWY15_01748 [Firmicutes bacterium ADurb.Bin193]|nr:MAG: hypothetical protein BWY15_01748 [Firmicutes bacterium ADurb.Bin193]
MYIYPDNLKSKAVMWLWELKDLGIIAIGTIISVLALTQVRLIVPLVITAVYAFLAIRLDDTSILQFIKNAYKFFIGKKQVYEWRFEDE